MEINDPIHHYEFLLSSECLVSEIEFKPGPNTNSRKYFIEVAFSNVFKTFATL